MDRLWSMGESMAQSALHNQIMERIWALGEDHPANRDLNLRQRYYDRYFEEITGISRDESEV